MATIIEETTGTACASCLAYVQDVDPEWWHGSAEALAHTSAAYEALSALGHVVVDTPEDNDEHFGQTCIVCGTPPLAGAIYSATLTLFAR